MPGLPAGLFDRRWNVRRAVVYTGLLISAGTECNEKTGRIGFTISASR